MRLMQSRGAVAFVFEASKPMRTDRHDDQFINDMIDAIQDYRRAKGGGVMPRDKAYSAAFFMLRRLKGKGWQFSPPLPIESGGVLMGSYKRK